MIKAKDLQRHPEDDRIVVINSMEDFHLWENRKALGFKGMILHNALPEVQLRFISKDISDVINKHINDSAANNEHICSTKKVLPDALQEWGYSPLTIDTIMKCSDLIQQLNHGLRRNFFIRKNSDHPKEPHKHGRTLSISFSGPSTQMVKKDFQFTPQEEKDGQTDTSKPNPADLYSIPAGSLIIFEDLWHLAPSLKKDSDETPRTTLII